MKIVDIAVKKVYRFNCPNCQSRLEADSKEVVDIGGKVCKFHCPCLLYTSRDYQNTAIVNCEQLLKELQRIVEIFEVDVNLYSRYVKAIDREIGLIKKWRQRDNRIKSQLRG